MIVGQVVVDRGQVDLERARDELAVVVQLVGDPDQVVVHVAEVDDVLRARPGPRSRFVSWLKISRAGDIARRRPISSRLSANSRSSVHDVGLRDDVVLERVDLVLDRVEHREVGVHDAVGDGVEQEVRAALRAACAGSPRSCGSVNGSQPGSWTVSSDRWLSRISQQTRRWQSILATLTRFLAISWKTPHVMRAVWFVSEPHPVQRRSISVWKTMARDCPTKAGQRHCCVVSGLTARAPVQDWAWPSPRTLWLPMAANSNSPDHRLAGFPPPRGCQSRPVNGSSVYPGNVDPR